MYKTAPPLRVAVLFMKVSLLIARVAEADVALYIAPPSLAYEFVNTESETVVNNNVTFQRATVMGTTTSTQITITGGTIIGTAGGGVTGNGTITVGTKADGDINNSSPVILGETVGINNKGTFNFYDGIIKGINDAILGTIGDQEPNTQVAESTETIDNKAYKTKYLEEIP